jgi:hypothetical protein
MAFRPEEWSDGAEPYVKLLSDSPTDATDRSASDRLTAAVDSSNLPPVAASPSFWEWARSTIDGFQRSAELAEEVRREVYEKAMEDAGGDKRAANNLLWNGPHDAWRHAEWSRRVANEVGPVTSFLSGAGHEAVTIADNIGRSIGYPLGFTKTVPQPYGALLQETLMDLSNNRYGRGQGRTPIELDDPHLVYGRGGAGTQPPLAIHQYLWR